MKIPPTLLPLYKEKSLGTIWRMSWYSKLQQSKHWDGAQESWIPVSVLPLRP